MKGKINYNIPFTDLFFFHVAMKNNYDINKIVDRLNHSEVNLDNKTLGWWILDLRNNTEIYSSKFRETLSATKENFPDNPESWKKYIKPEDLEIATKNLEKHIKTKGVSPFSQTVTYNKVDGSGEVSVICHGIVVKWSDDGAPELMIGLHFNEYGFLEFDSKESTPFFFKSFDSVPLNKEIELYKGCNIEVIKKTDDLVVLLCKMGEAVNVEGGCTLPEHHHPDYIEEFKTIEGFLIDKKSGRELTTKNKYVFPRFINHIMHCPKSWVGEIYCKKVD